MLPLLLAAGAGAAVGGLNAYNERGNAQKRNKRLRKINREKTRALAYGLDYDQQLEENEPTILAGILNGAGVGTSIAKLGGVGFDTKMPQGSDIPSGYIENGAIQGPMPDSSGFLAGPNQSIGQPTPQTSIYDDMDMWASQNQRVAPEYATRNQTKVGANLNPLSQQAIFNPYNNQGYER